MPRPTVSIAVTEGSRASCLPILKSGRRFSCLA